MTVIAAIPYKGGIVMVADSRATIEGSGDTLLTEKLTKLSKGVISAQAGSSSLIELAKAVVQKYAGDLEQGKDVKDAIRKELITLALKEGSTGHGDSIAELLIAIKQDNGTIKLMSAGVFTGHAPYTDPSAAPDADVGDIPHVYFNRVAYQRPTAGGVDGSPQQVLNFIIEEHVADPSNMTEKEAEGAAYMLEHYYILHNAYVGGPIRMSVIDKEGIRDISDDEMKQAAEELKKAVQPQKEAGQNATPPLVPVKGANLLPVPVPEKPAPLIAIPKSESEMQRSGHEAKRTRKSKSTG